VERVDKMGCPSGTRS